MLRKIGLALAVSATAIIGPIVVGANKSYAPLPAAAIGPDITLESGIVRKDVRFPCGETRCAGWLFLPAGVAKPPVVVMAHGFGGTRGGALPEVAVAFASQGIAALTFDYRNFGASGGAPRQLLDVKGQLADWASAISFATQAAELNGNRLGLWGTSLGGGHALIAAARNASVKAVVAQVPLIDTARDGEVAQTGENTIRMLAAAWGGLWVSAFGFEPWTMPAIAPAGGLGMIADDGAYGTLQVLAMGDAAYRNEIVAYSIFLFDDYNPSAMAGGLRAPTLLLASRTDRFVPFSAVEDYASKSESRTIREVACDHFEIYSEPCRADASNAAARFFARHLSDE